MLGKTQIGVAVGSAPAHLFYTIFDHVALRMTFEIPRFQRLRPPNRERHSALRPEVRERERLHRLTERSILPCAETKPLSQPRTPMLRCKYRSVLLSVRSCYPSAPDSLKKCTTIEPLIFLSSNKRRHHLDQARTPLAEGSMRAMHTIVARCHRRVASSLERRSTNAKRARQPRSPILGVCGSECSRAQNRRSEREQLL